MPICTTCTQPLPHLYTLYQSAHNLRLEQCVRDSTLQRPHRFIHAPFDAQSNCHAFADPYVEHDSLTILLDLILLKPGVYRHLLFNRGAVPRRAVVTHETVGADGSELAERWGESEKRRVRVCPTRLN